MPAKSGGTPISNTCSFCDKDQSQVHRLICGPNSVSICDECVGLCNEILREDSTASAQVTGGKA